MRDISFELILGERVATTPLYHEHIDQGFPNCDPRVIPGAEAIAIWPSDSIQTLKYDR